MNRYFPYPFMIFGTIGLILNVAIFTRQSLCNNSCVQYLLFNTLSNFIVLYWVVTTRIVSDGYGDDLGLRSDSFCKIRYFLTYYSRTLSTWFIVLACIDRWLSSIQAKQRFNKVLFARRVGFITCIICFISYAHILFLFGIQKDPVSLSVTCYALPGIYRLFSDLQYLIFYALAPPIFMLIFGIITLRNIRRNRRLVIPLGITRNQIKNNLIKRRDSQLLAMLLLQIFVIIIFTLPFAIQKLMDTLTLQLQRTAVQKAQWNLITAILRLLSYGSHALGFFFYTLSAKIFRVELLKIMNRIYLWCTGKNFLRPTMIPSLDASMMRNGIDATQTIDYQRYRQPKYRAMFKRQNK
ncbi:unnamed protein product [Adineta steineri]|uniref:G-protein coupled receptors family 1 profile domain-containing protein n=1 Tax=Adineta steineri TaxID=433720 RepID=A0A815FJU5_9BILA|nr:unnamed protein product [Adineta steineri]CAF1584320.1 unnamed protein product [Adineta steineri]